MFSPSKSGMPPSVGPAGMAQPIPFKYVSAPTANLVTSYRKLVAEKTKTSVVQEFEQKLIQNYDDKSHSLSLTEQENKETCAKITSLEKQIAPAKSEIEQLLTTKKNIEQETVAANKSFATYPQAARALAVQERQLRQQQATIQAASDHPKWIAREKSLYAQYDDLAHKKSALEHQRVSQQTALKKEEDTVVRLQKEVLALPTNAILDAQQDHYIAQLDTLKPAIAKLEDQLSVLRKQATTPENKKSVALKVKELQLKQDKRDKLEKDQADLQKTYVNCCDQILHFNSTVAQFEQKRAQHQSAERALQNDVKDIDVQLAKIDDEIVEVHAWFKKFDSTALFDVSKSLKEVATAFSKLPITSKQRATLQGILENLAHHENRLKSVENDLDELTKKLSPLQQEEDRKRQQADAMHQKMYAIQHALRELAESMKQQLEAHDKPGAQSKGGKAPATSVPISEKFKASSSTRPNEWETAAPLVARDIHEGMEVHLPVDAHRMPPGVLEYFEKNPQEITGFYEAFPGFSARANKSGQQEIYYYIVRANLPFPQRFPVNGFELVIAAGKPTYYVVQVPHHFVVGGENNSKVKPDGSDPFDGKTPPKKPPVSAGHASGAPTGAGPDPYSGSKAGKPGPSGSTHGSYAGAPPHIPFKTKLHTPKHKSAPKPVVNKALKPLTTEQKFIEREFSKGASNTVKAIPYTGEPIDLSKFKTTGLTVDEIKALVAPLKEGPHKLTPAQLSGLQSSLKFYMVNFDNDFQNIPDLADLFEVYKSQHAPSNKGEFIEYKKSEFAIPFIDNLYKNIFTDALTDSSLTDQKIKEQESKIKYLEFLERANPNKYEKEKAAFKKIPIHAQVQRNFLRLSNLLVT